MIFTRIRVGNVKPWEMGKKPCVTFPCLTQLPPLKTATVSWGSYGWEWSVAGLSILAHMHTPPADWTSRWEEEWLLRILPIVCSSTRIGGAIHPHAGTIVCSLFSRTGFFLVFTHTASWEPCSFIHDFPVKGHSRFRLYDLLIDWYGRVIFHHFDVEIGTVVLPVSYGCRRSPQDSCVVVVSLTL